MTSTTVRRRLTLYISGFDPKGPSHYHRLYREQAALQSQVSGHQISIGTRQRIDSLRDQWELQTHIENTDTYTQYQFLRWDDVVRSHWHPGHWNYLRMVLSATMQGARDGSLWRLLKCSFPAFFVTVGPFVILLLTALGAAACLTLLLWALITGLDSHHHIEPWAIFLLVSLIPSAAALVGISLFAERRWYMGWTARGYTSYSRQGREQTPDIDARLDQHTEHLLRCLQDPQWDEILLVGHSYGAMLASIIAGRAAQHSPQALQDDRLSLLTLGHCFPLLSYQNSATRFRRDIHAAAHALASRWLDFTAPSDRCSTPLVDPTDAVRVLENTNCPSPKLLSTRVATLYHPQDYAQLRKNHFDLHFHYIRATQLPGLYDYFAITAGPQTLAQRFAQHPSVQGWKKFECFGGPFPRSSQSEAPQSSKTKLD